MTEPSAEHSALVAKVTADLERREYDRAGPPADRAWELRVHRQALETLNRHHPELQREWVPPQYAPNPPGPAIETRPAHMWEHWVCDGCDIWTNMGEAQREYENCPEVAGVRAVYLPTETEN